MKYFKFLLFILAFIISCKPKENMIYLSNHNFQEESKNARYTGLRIKEGDILEITVSAFDENAVKPFNLSTITSTNMPSDDVLNSKPNQYIVSSEGYINFPVLGKVFCLGMTKQQLNEDFQQRLKIYLIDPLIDIKLVNLNISVLGEVGNPGVKTSPNERINLFQALALAGDMTPAADRTKVKLLRYSDQTKIDTIITLDFSEANIVNSPYYYLQQNDILYVEPDKNKQIAANSTNPNKALLWQLVTVAVSITALLIRFTR